MRQVLQWLAALALTTSMAHAEGDAELCAQQAEQAPTLREKGALVEALRLYEGCAADRCPRVVRDDCRADLLELRKSVPRLAVHVRDEHRADLPDAQVTLDGKVVVADEYTRGVPIDPGTHTVRAVRPPLRDVEENVVIATGDPLRVLDLTLPSIAPIITPHPVREVMRKNRTASIAVSVIGLVSLATWGVLATWTLVDFNNLSSTCPNCTSSQIQDAHTRGYVADVFLGTGVVALAIATVLWFTAPTRSRPPTVARW